MSKSRSRRAVSLSLAGVIVLGAGASASASIPSADGRIQSCIRKNGAIRVIDADAGGECSGSERPLAWNRKGPAGPAGPPGPAGASGTVQSGLCQYAVTEPLHAGTQLVMKCRHAAPELRNVAVTPTFADGFAEDTYVLRPVLDYAWRFDIESGDASEFWIIIDIMREVPHADVKRAVLLSWVATP